MASRIQKLNKHVAVGLALLALLSVCTPLLLKNRAEAAAFGSGTFVRLDRLTGTTATTGRVCAKPATVATEGKIIVNFPATAATDFSVSTTLTNWATNSTFESGFSATAMPITNATQATSVSGKTVTWNLSTDLTVGTLYCFNWSNTAAVSTSSAGAAVSAFAYVETQTGASGQIDKSFWGATIISGDTVQVDAVVAPYFTMALSHTTDPFPSNLSTASVNTTAAGARYIQVDTNALNGWILWARGTNLKTVSDTGSGNSHGALTSTNAGGYAISNNTTNYLATPTNSSAHTLSAGTEDYALATTINSQGTGAGTASPNAVYSGTGANQGGVPDPTQYRPIASSTGTAVNARVNIFMLATISTATPPGSDYTDTIRYVGAGQF